jgi:hypothetical protein
MYECHAPVAPERTNPAWRGDLLILKHMWVRTYKNPSLPHAQKRTKTHKNARRAIAANRESWADKTMARPTWSEHRTASVSDRSGRTFRGAQKSLRRAKTLTDINPTGAI